MSSTLARHSNINGPDIPTEIWSHIFGLALLEPTSSADGPSKVNKTLLCISHTCCLWRSIALDISSLWTTIQIRLNNPEYEDSRKRDIAVWPDAKLNELWIQRSTMQPLDISINGYGVEKLDNPIVQNRIKRMFGTMSRWRNVRLDFQEISNDFIPDILDWKASGTDLHIPLMENLYLRTIYHYEDANKLINILPSRLWQKAPRLRKLHLDLQTVNEKHPVNFHNWVLSCGIPFQQLSELIIVGNEYETVSVAETIEILRTSTNLVSCRLECVSNCETVSVSESLNDIKPFSLPNLQHLCLETCIRDQDTNTGFPIARILVRFSAPNVKTIKIGFDDAWQQESFAAFIKNSGCTLISLDLDHTPLLTAEFEECMCLIPSLEYIHRGMSDMSAEPILKRSTFQKLENWDDSSRQFVVWPRLKTFSMDFSGLSESVKDTPFTQMIKTRLTMKNTEGEVCLKKVRLGNCDKKTPAPILELRGLHRLRKKHGLQLEFPHGLWETGH